MEIPLRAALLAWLAGDATLAASINAFTEEAPVRATVPWLGVVASASTDWSTKTELGRDVRVALELHCRGDQPDAAGALVAAIESRIAAMPRAQSGFSIAGIHFLRARAEQRTETTRAVLLEYRFRVFAG